MNNARQLFSAFAVCAACALPLSGQAQEAEIISTRPGVAVSTSFCSAWENLGAVNDGRVGASSAERPGMDENPGYGYVYGNWDTHGQTNWVMYEFPDEVVMTEAAVYWFTDHGGLLMPEKAYVEYYDEAAGAFVNAGDIGTQADRFNVLPLPEVLSRRIRISMYHSTQSTGIVEFRVKGTVPVPTPFAAFGSRVGDGEWETGVGHRTVARGATVSYAVSIDAAQAVPGTWEWTGPNGFSSSDSLLTLSGVDSDMTGTYTVTFTNAGRGKTRHDFSLAVYDGEVGTPYAWKEYRPSLNYNFRKLYPDFQAPAKDLEEFPVAGRISEGWWTYAWGPKANHLATDKVGQEGIRNMLARMNKDFEYFREVMGWPPDLRARNGYRSTIYLYGSGLPTDNADSTALGGWQSATTYEGVTYPMVLISYYPVYSFHPDCPYPEGDKSYQTGAVVHEGIHALLADLPGCKGSAWIQEGGNTWLQQEYESRKSGNYGEMGFLNAGALIAPFMPIECYSGWLLDGSFGGPAAEGVNVYNEAGQQLCNWRNLLGGTQYGNLFVVFLAQTLGDGIVPWIWSHCPNRVLEGMADTLGCDQMRRLVTEYRAKQAMLDFKEWTGATRKLLDNNFNGVTQQEYEPYAQKVEPWNMTPYVKCTTDDNGLLVPEERTLPGWSGANQIPLHIAGRDTLVSVEFLPRGRNMALQLCYRTKSGKIVYSTPVPEGECVLKLPAEESERPANEVVIAVVSNTDYVYEGDETRKAKFDYRLRLLRGACQAARPDIKWYEYERELRDPDYTGVDAMAATGQSAFRVLPGIVRAGESIRLDFARRPGTLPLVSIVSPDGVVVRRARPDASGRINLPDRLGSGVYFVSTQQGGKTQAARFVVK